MAMREDMRRNRLSCLFGIPALFWYFGLMVIPLFIKLVRPQCFCFWHFDGKEFGQYPAMLTSRVECPFVINYPFDV